MKNILITLTALIMATSGIAQSDFYKLSAKDINGEEVNFSDFEGKKLLIVNTASKCGFTKQYEGLQELHEEFGGEDFMIIGFPSNDFMNQEPGTEEEIKAFCEKNYGVSFLMMSKIKVKGKEKHEVYKWLTSKKQNGVKDSKVKWNFQKYMVSKEGEFVGVVGTRSKPYSEEILNFIKS